MRIAFPKGRPLAGRPAVSAGRVALARAARAGAGVALALALLLPAIVAPAAADVGTTIINRCLHGQSISGFSQQDYRRALQELPTEVEEYSECGEVIRSAQLALAGGGSTPGGGAATIATPLTPAERSVLRRVPKTGSTPIVVGGTIVDPGVVHANVASALSSLPTPLLATLAFLLACALVLAGGALRNRVRARRSS
jgi:hypothetical protein